MTYTAESTFDGHDHYVMSIVDRLTAAPEREVIHYGGRWIRAGELRGHICGTVEGLSKMGMGPGSTVAVLTEPNHPLMLAVRYAAHLLGARVVYVRSTNPRSEETALSAAERAAILLETDADMLFVDPASLAAGLELRRLVAGELPIAGFDVGPTGAPGVQQLLPRDNIPPGTHISWAPDSIAAITYTTGTTGTPKGVRISYRAWLTMVRGFASAQLRPLRFLAVTPISQSASTMLDACILTGGSVVVHMRFDAREALEAISSHHVSGGYFAVPHLYAMLDSWSPETDMSALECVIYSGTPASPRRLEQAGRLLPRTLIQSYGTTEAGPISVLLPADHRDPDLRGTVGRPLPRVTVRILDPATQEEVPRGDFGEVWVRSPTVMEGYVGDPGRGAAVLRDGWLRTGDLGAMDGRGYLRLGGRVDDFIKAGGVKVFPAAVEEALMAHQDVGNASVFGVRLVDDVEEVRAAVALKPGSAVTGLELRELVRHMLSPSHVPAVIDVWSSVPLTANGKIDRELLRRSSQLAAPSASDFITRW